MYIPTGYRNPHRIKWPRQIYVFSINTESRSVSMFLKRKCMSSEQQYSYGNSACNDRWDMPCVTHSRLYDLDKYLAENNITPMKYIRT
jgi:hypothetical protein